MRSYSLLVICGVLMNLLIVDAGMAAGTARSAARAGTRSDSGTNRARETQPAIPAAAPAAERRALPAWVLAPTPAREGHELSSLAEAITLARRENAELRALGADIERARAGLTTARLAGRYNPEIEVSGGINRSPDENNPSSDNSENQWEIGISQEIEIAGQERLRLSVAELELARAQAVAEQASRETIWSIGEAWWEALAAEQLAQLARDAESARVWLAEAAGIRFEVGEGARIEVTLASIEAARARAERLTAEQAATAARARLTEAIGLADDSPAAPGGSFPELAPVSDDLAKLALRERRDLYATQLAISIAEEQQTLALAEGSANLTLGAGYEREGGSTDIYSVRVGIPLSVNNRNRGAAEAAAAEEKAARERAEALRRRIASEAATAHARADRARQGIATLDESMLAKSTDALRQVAEAYMEGKISLSELMVYFNEAIATRRAAVEARREAALAGVALDRAAGIDRTMGER